MEVAALYCEPVGLRQSWAIFLEPEETLDYGKLEVVLTTGKES